MPSTTDAFDIYDAAWLTDTTALVTYARAESISLQYVPLGIGILRVKARPDPR
jgi:hypothetical protein